MKKDRSPTFRRRLDERFTHLGSLDAFTVPNRGWIRAIREALGMSGAQLARRLGVATQSLADLERSEASGTVQLKTLRRAAEALDCTLVYALVPNGSLEDTVERRARAVAIEQLAAIGHTMDLEAQGLTPERREEQIADYIATHLRPRDLWAVSEDRSR